MSVSAGSRDLAPVVLLPAFPLTSAMWTPLRAYWPRDIVLRTPDYRSSELDVAPSLDVLADDLAAALDADGVQRAVVGGVSMGGYVTMAFLRRHRDRVAGVVLADTKAEPDAEQPRANRLRIASALETSGSVQLLVDEVAPRLLGSTTYASRPDVVAQLHGWVAQASPAATAWYERAMADRPDSFGTLAATTVPALVVLGAQDALVTEQQAAAMVTALPAGRLATLPGAGHLGAVETPQLFAELVSEFVRELARR